MLRFKVIGLLVPEKKIFLRFLSYMGMAAIHVTKTVWTYFRSSIPEKLHMKFEFDWPSGFRGEDV